MKAQLVVLFLISFWVTGCSQSAPRSDESPNRESAPQLSEAARVVRTSQGDPTAACEEVGPIEGKDGYTRAGGLFGARVGTYENAYVHLRNVAAERGGNFVRIDSQQGPHMITNRASSILYVIRGVLFRCPKAS